MPHAMQKYCSMAAEAAWWLGDVSREFSGSVTGGVLELLILGEDMGLFCVPREAER